VETVREDSHAPGRDMLVMMMMLVMMVVVVVVVIMMNFRPT